jgi:hypothetical protein
VPPRGNFVAPAPVRLLKGNMNNIDTEIALWQLRAARDLIISAHTRLNDNGAYT